MTRRARPGRRGGAVLVPLLLAVSLAAPPAAAAAPVVASAGEVSVRDGEVETVVTVRGLAPGQSVDPAAVRVTAAGVPWPATAVPVERGRVSRTAVLVVDTSGSMGSDGIAAARAAAESYLAAVPTDVAVGLLTFSSDVQLVVAPTTDRAAVRAALATMTPSGETRLYDALDAALAAVGGTGERALVVLSDGADTSSGVGLDDVRAALTASGVAADFVAFRTGEAQVGVLEDLAAHSGGQVSEAHDPAQLAGVFTTAASALGDQIVVTADVPDGAGGATDVTVEVPTTAGTATAVVAAQLPPPVGAGTVAGTPGTVERGVPWLLPAVVAVSFLALLLLFGMAFVPGLVRESQSQRRAREVRRYGVSGLAQTAAADTPTALGQAALTWADRTVQQRGLEESWALDLDRAAVPLKPHEWLLVRVGCAVAGLAVAVVFLPWWLLTAPVAALAGYLLPGLYLGVRAGRRVKRFENDLPDVLQLVAGSLRSGFSLAQAVDSAGRDGQEPIRGELARALAESRLGVPLEDTLDRVAVRMKSNDLSWTVMAIRISREVGGNLAEVLLNTAETIRERGRVQRQVRALSAEGRLSAYVLIGLPVGLALFLAMFRGEYIGLLLTDPIGWGMTAYAVLSVGIGAVVMNRLVKVEV